ncbi:hypothetical protein BS78_02G005300 [Paspalum vaginatum]|nr:hypothetical protein BS78_02G005300 [Paspalum vaginatum]
MWFEGGVAGAFAPPFPTMPPSPAAIYGTRSIITSLIGVPLPSTAASTFFMHASLDIYLVHRWHVVELPFPFLCFALLCLMICSNLSIPSLFVVLYSNLEEESPLCTHTSLLPCLHQHANAVMQLQAASREAK